MKLYLLHKNLGTTWSNVWYSTKAEAVDAAGARDSVILICTKGDKSSGLEMLNNSTMHHSNFCELDGVVLVEKVWPTKLRR